MEPYYYASLSKIQQNTYQAMLTGLRSLSPSFSVPLLEGKQLSEVFQKLRLDHPLLFYAGTFQYRYYPDSNYAELIPEYLFEKGKIQEHQKAMQARIEKLARPMKQSSETEKLLYIHDFICQNVRYDKLKKQYSHEIIGPLGHGVGVCEGMAKAVKALCDAMGLWCIVALSENNPEKGIKYRHAWNVVRVGKTYYHVDCTFDRSLGEPEAIRYDYFMLSDAQIFRDHEKLVWQIPQCEDGSRFYYKEKKLSFTKAEDVRKRAAQAVKKGRTLLFHWRGGYLTREVVKDFLQIFQEEGAKKEKHPRVFLNWAQAVIKVDFVDAVPLETLTMEEANEGEQE